MPSDIQRRKDQLIEKCKFGIRNDLLPGSPLKQAIDHEVQLVDGAGPLHRAMIKFSPSELLGTKKLRDGYVKYGNDSYLLVSLWNSSRLRHTNDKLRGVIDYRCRNKTTKRNNTPVPRTDEIFEDLKKTTVYSKVDLKSGVHEISVWNVDIKKTAFRT